MIKLGLQSNNHFSIHFQERLLKLEVFPGTDIQVFRNNRLYHQIFFTTDGQGHLPSRCLLKTPHLPTPSQGALVLQLFSLQTTVWRSLVNDGTVCQLAEYLFWVLYNCRPQHTPQPLKSWAYLLLFIVGLVTRKPWPLDMSFQMVSFKVSVSTASCSLNFTWNTVLGLSIE